MYKKGDLVQVQGGCHAIFLGGERLKEDFDENGYGGLFIPEVHLLIVKDSPNWNLVRSNNSKCHSRVGKKMWVQRKYVRGLRLS